MKKNAGTYVTKADFFQRFTVLYNELIEKIYEKPGRSELHELKKALEERIEKNRLTFETKLAALKTQMIATDQEREKYIKHLTLEVDSVQKEGMKKMTI